MNKEKLYLCDLLEAFVNKAVCHKKNSLQFIWEFSQAFGEVHHENRGVKSEIDGGSSAI